MRRLDIPATAARLRGFISSTFAESGLDGVVVALSGGVDSSTALALASSSLGPGQLFVLSLPYQDWHAESQHHARLLQNALGIPLAHFHEVDITPLVAAFAQVLPVHVDAQEAQPDSEELLRVRLGNLMARARMVVLYDYAKQLNSLVLGTENKSEHWLGYYTRFGDEASDLEPLRGLYKTEVFQLAEHLGLPRVILEAAPSAGLWPGQTDEGQFGFSYRQADEILYGIYEAGLSTQDLKAQGFSPETVQAVKSWVERMAFKSRLPYLSPEPVILQH